MYSTFFTFIQTADDLELMQEEVLTLLNSFYENKQTFDDALKSKVRKKTADAIREAAERGHDVKELLESLAAELNKLERFKITLAIELTQLGIDKVYSYIVQQLGRRIVLEISYDPTIVGGAVISFQGNYRDFSLSRFLDMEFEKNREEIIRTLERRSGVSAPSSNQKA